MRFLEVRQPPRQLSHSPNSESNQRRIFRDSTFVFSFLVHCEPATHLPDSTRNHSQHHRYLAVTATSPPETRHRSPVDPFAFACSLASNTSSSRAISIKPQLHQKEKRRSPFAPLYLRHPPTSHSYRGVSVRRLPGDASRDNSRWALFLSRAAAAGLYPRAGRRNT